MTAACADVFGFTVEQALLMSASFGGGIGRMRQTCGAACGLFLLAGLETGTVQADDREGKSHNYAVVQQLAKRFKEEAGALSCADLLGLQQKLPAENPQAETRTPTYYAKRPCACMVELAARIFADYLTEHKSAV